MVFQSLGRPDIPMKLSLMRLALIFLTMYPLVRWLGIFGAGLSITLASLAVLPVLLWHTQVLIGHRITEYLKLISVPLAATALMAGVLLGLKRAIDLTVFIEFPLLVVIGAALYIGLLFAVGRFRREYDPVQILREVRGGWK